jgi:hypothetical protein
MSLLQRNDLYQKADHWHPAFRPSGVMNSNVSEVIETDEDLILSGPDDVTSSGQLNVLERAASAPIIVLAADAYITRALLPRL